MVVKMMRKILPRPNARLLSRSKSTLSQSLPDNEPLLPKMPPFDYAPPPYTGPSAEEILAKRREYLNPAIFHFFKKPLCLVDGKMQYLFDEKGRRYLDAFGGIATVSCGHRWVRVPKMG